MLLPLTMPQFAYICASVASCNASVTNDGADCVCALNVTTAAGFSDATDLPSAQRLQRHQAVIDRPQPRARDDHHRICPAREEIGVEHLPRDRHQRAAGTPSR